MTTARERDRSVRITVEPFDHQNGGDWPGMRGHVIGATTPYTSGRVFAMTMPSVWVTDAGDVDITDVGVVPLETFRSWLTQVSAELDRLAPDAGVQQQDSSQRGKA